MNKLVVDIGNTRIKAGIFSDNTLIETFVLKVSEWNLIQSVLKKKEIHSSILANVGNEIPQLDELLLENTSFHRLKYGIKLPFSTLYETPETLGVDRIAAVAGAIHFFENTNCLLIDIGTCVTYDFVSNQRLHAGGAISNGLQMRLDAMHTYTSKLPKLTFTPIDDFVGVTTASGMLSGAYYGLVHEINGTIDRYIQRYGNLQVIICGGDAPIFAKHIKSNIFAAPLLVLYGLNRILDFQNE